jgi:hypothetical protein
MLVEFQLCYDDEAGKWVALNKETGEVREFTAATKKTTTTRTTKKKKEDENPNPQVTLEDNKYSLNSAAVALMNIEPDMKLCIKMKKIDGSMLPIIGTNTAFKVKDGNRITQKFTVACRGANHDALAAYGTIFDLEPNPELEGTFIMRGDKGSVIVNDDNIAKDVELPDDLKVNLDDSGDDMPDLLDENFDGAAFESLLNNIDL